MMPHSTLKVAKSVAVVLGGSDTHKIHTQTQTRFNLGSLCDKGPRAIFRHTKVELSRQQFIQHFINPSDREYHDSHHRIQQIP